MTDKRRRAGEGSVSPLPSGRVRVRLTLADGGRVSMTASDADEAERLRRGALVSLANAELAPVGAMTLKVYGPKVLDRRELAGMRNSRTDRQRWATHIETAPFADWPLADVRPRDVRGWLEALARKKTSHQSKAGQHAPRKLSAQTIKHCLNLLRRICQAAVEDDLLSENPCRDVRPPRVDQRTEEPWAYLSPQEQTALLTCPGIPEAERLIIAFAIGTGLRQGEQWNLELRDLHVDGDDPHVFVRFGSRGKPPKNGKTRKVPLFGVALAAARRWLELLPTYATQRQADKTRVPFNPESLVFPTARGCRRQHGKYGRSSAGEQRGTFERALLAAGIERRIRWHDLRHSCASSLVAGWWGRTWRLEEVREVLGHSSIKVTERYAHLAHSALREAAQETTRGLVDTTQRRSREGHALPGSSFETTIFRLRARHDSNVRPAASKAEAKGQGNQELGPPRDRRVTSAARAFLEAVASRCPGDDAELLARALAGAVLASPEYTLALAVLQGGPYATRRATELADLVLGVVDGAGEREVG